MPRLIALDVGSHAVKVSSYRVSGRQVSLEERHHQPVPQDGTSPSLEHRMAALDALLDDVPSLLPSGSDVTVLAYPSYQATFRRVRMPFTDRGQIEGTLPFTVENEVPFDLDDMVLGWRIAAQEDHSEIVTVLARHDQLKEWITSLQERSIDPASVHVDADLYGPWGVLESWIPADPDDPAPAPLVAVIDVGHLHATITVVQEGVAQLCRSVNLGGFAFTRAIQEALGCTWDEAEQLKHGAVQVEAPPESTEPSLGDPGAPRRATSGYAQLPIEAKVKLDDAIKLLLAEIRSTLIQAEDVLSAEVGEVRLTGGSSRLEVLWDRLADDLGVPVRPAEDPSGDGATDSFSLSSALAGASVPGAPAVVDLRVGDLQFRGGTNVLRSALFYGMSLAGCFVLAATLMFGWQYWSLSQEQRSAEQSVIDIVNAAVGDQLEGVTIDNMDTAKSAMAGVTEDAAQLAAVVGEGKGVPPTIDALHSLTQAFPPHPEVTVELSDLVITRSTISFNAETSNFDSSAKVEAQLRANPRFANATKGQETKKSNGQVKFPITIPLGDATETNEEG